MRILVVGAGIAGLTAAYRLQESGHEVLVLEREETAGGRMRSERVGDFVVDRGAQFIASAYRNMRALARELGIDDRIHEIERSDNAMVRDGKLWLGTYDSIGRLLGSGYLSLGAKLRLPMILAPLLLEWRRLDPMRPETAVHLDDEDMPAFLRRWVDDEVLEYASSRRCRAPSTASRRRSRKHSCSRPSASSSPASACWRSRAGTAC